MENSPPQAAPQERQRKAHPRQAHPAARNAIAILLLIGGSASTSHQKAVAQTAPAMYWVQFTDKGHTPYTLHEPGAYLSQRALERRSRQGVAIDSLDLPVDPAYVAQLQAAGDIQVMNASKWFNALTIRTTDTLALDTLGQLPFVKRLRVTRDGQERPHSRPLKLEPQQKDFARSYGEAFRQVEMMNGHLLHQIANAQGQGMLIGVLDSGFEDADILPGLADLRARDGIALTRDMVTPGGNVYQAHFHGRSVLSVMAGHVEGELLGTAPLARYALVRTEDAASEYLVEEDNWVSGAELLDSLGCDVLTTSLGYTTFDDTTQDHTYEDLNGMTSRMTRAADIAAAKGMVVVNSAGNSGELPWRYISVPADAFNILAVGAVDADRQLAGFSSRGPSADGRVKPDVSAMGLRTIGLDIGGENVGPISGTSFAAPLVAGLSACLWQLHQDRSAHEIVQAVRRSASQHDHPDDDLGYGIPDFWRAHLLLGGRDLTDLVSPTLLGVLPMPFTEFMDVELFAGGETRVELNLYDLLGRAVWQGQAEVEPEVYTRVRVGEQRFRQLPAGAYILSARMGTATLIQRVVKAR